MTTAGANTAQTPRVEAPPNVTAQAVSTEDLPCPAGSLDGGMWRSPYAHTRLVSIDAERLVTREPLGHLHPFLDPRVLRDGG
jgi:xanthine dehydrogenase molybdopterin-binding subunit B